MEALKEERLISDIALEYGVHPSVIHRWKKELLDSAPRVFAASREAKMAEKEQQKQEKTNENLYAQVGRLRTQLEWLKKNLAESYPVNNLKAIVEWDNEEPHLAIKAQAELLSVNRTSLYRTAKEVSKLEFR